ncbi:MAG: C4-dicarboxylate TRAP transporter substrate-binding protein [Lachnospiraceae bacterium]|nr:C4-dicarboxylate TRAP transporter substrate-binding protein [Lachnospiraceae bacterium]
MKKQLLCGIMAVCMAAGLTACKGKESTAPSNNTAAETTAETYNLKVSHVQGDKAPVVQALYQFEKDVEAASDGRIQVEVFPNGSLGDAVDLINQCKTGSNVAFMTDAGRFSDIVPNMGVICGPYLFDDYETGNKMVQTDVFQSWCDELASEGYKVLSFNYYEGDRNILTTKPINSMADLKDVKLRTGSTKQWVDTLTAFGAIPTSLAQSEVYTGIQQKVVDGADQQVVTVNDMQLYEVCKHYTMTHQYQLMLGLVLSNDWFEKLPEDLQQILVDNSVKAGEYSSKLTLELVDQQLENMKGKGLEVNDTIDLTEFKAVADQVYEAEGLSDARQQLLDAIK